MKKINHTDCLVVIPTFYPGKKIINCINSIPKDYPVAIMDNGEDLELESIIKTIPRKINHYKVGDIGLPKSFNLALDISDKNYIFITQPDVVLEKNCIENLLLAAKKYPNSGILCPLFYEGKLYSYYDFYDLKFNKKNFKLIKAKKIKNKKILPSGDFCIDAVNSTAILIKKNILLKIGKWDEKIYTYLEDLDLSLRIRAAGHEIIKVYNSKVFHEGFQSHKEINKEVMNISRNWHFCWSSIYFKKKHSNKVDFFIYFINIFLKCLWKSIVYFLLRRRSKYIENFTRLKACLSFVICKESYFRPMIKKNDI